MASLANPTCWVISGDRKVAKFIVSGSDYPIFTAVFQDLMEKKQDLEESVRIRFVPMEYIEFTCLMGDVMLLPEIIGAPLQGLMIEDFANHIASQQARRTTMSMDYKFAILDKTRRPPNVDEEQVGQRVKVKLSKLRVNVTDEKFALLEVEPHLIALWHHSEIPQGQELEALSSAVRIKAMTTVQDDANRAKYTEAVLAMAKKLSSQTP